MCAVSAISNHYMTQWTTNPIPSPTDEIKKELREIVRRLDEIDKKLGEKDCKDEQKDAFYEILGMMKNGKLKGHNE